MISLKGKVLIAEVGTLNQLPPFEVFYIQHFYFANTKFNIASNVVKKWCFNLLDTVIVIYSLTLSVPNKMHIISHVKHATVLKVGDKLNLSSVK